MKRSELPLLLVAVYAVAWFALMRLPGDILRSPIAGTDLSSFYTAGAMARGGEMESLYAVGPDDTILGDATGGPWKRAGEALGIARQHYYIYPPFFALLMAPLSLIPFGAARLAWLAGDLVMLAIVVTCYLRQRARGAAACGPLEIVLITVTLGLEFLPLIWAMAIGQTSLILLAALVGARLLLSQGRESAAGALVGIATAIKLTPALILLWLGLRGHARAAAAGLIVFAASLAAGVAAGGIGPTWIFFSGVAPMMSGGTPYFLNQSLAGFFARLDPAADVRQVALAMGTLPRAGAALTGMAMLGITGWVLWKERSRGTLEGRPRGLAFDLEFSAMMLLTLILSPIAWSHHYLFALVPLWTIVAVLGRMPAPGWVMPVAAGAAWLLISRKPHFELFLQGPGRLALSAALYGAIALWAIILVLIHRGAARATSAERVLRAA